MEWIFIYRNSISKNVIPRNNSIEHDILSAFDIQIKFLTIIYIFQKIPMTTTGDRWWVAMGGNKGNLIFL